MKKIIITGGNGRFASELKKIKTNYKLIFLTKNELDILKPKSISNAIKKFKPKYIIHLAGLSRPLHDHEKEISTFPFFNTTNIHICAHFPDLLYNSR